jgi:menaquinone-dependent protoporphyrinogen oxidase
MNFATVGSTCRSPMPTTTSRARDHRVFAGKLDKADLNLAERATVRIVHAPYGDAREWGEIRSWAATIATELTGAVTNDAPTMRRSGFAS